MVFRNLEAFNLALLPKQSWRLLHYPDSLFYKVYKAKYFFIISGLCFIFCWRSISYANGTITTGCLWQIRNGNQIQVWDDNWLPRSPKRKVHTACNILPSDARVVALLDVSLQEWNIELMWRVFLAK